MHTLRPLQHLALAGALALSVVLPAHAGGEPIAYRYTQTGFADGASVSGWFVGRDEDADGMLYAFELSDFGFSFSGNRAVPAFSMGMENRAGLEFDISAEHLMHMHVVGPGDSHELEYDAFGWPGYDIPGRVSNNLDGLISITWQTLEVTPMSPVPEPPPTALWLTGLTVLGALARRRSGAAGR